MSLRMSSDRIAKSSKDMLRDARSSVSGCRTYPNPIKQRNLESNRPVASYNA